MVKEIRIVLREDKKINGKIKKAGTVMGTISCKKGFTRKDIDISMQLGEIKIVDCEKSSKGKKEE
jgi:hypothetical protein